MDAATIIESESRELIRRRGLDVRTDQLEPLIREVMSDYDRRSSSGEVPVLRDDDETMVAEVAARIGGFGPLQEMLDDPTIEEIWLNSPSRSAYFLFVQRECHQVIRLDRMRASDIRTGLAAIKLRIKEHEGKIVRAQSDYDNEIIEGVDLK